MSACLGLSTHPILCIDTLTQGNLQVLYQSNHTLLRLCGEILLNIKLADGLTQNAADC